MAYREKKRAGGLFRRSAWVVLAALAVAGTGGCAVTPRVITHDEALAGANKDVAVLEQTPEPLSGPVDLNEAIARAVKYNREQRLTVMEAALAQRQLNMARFDMLPELTATAGYQERDEFAASASTTFIDGTPAPLDPNPTFSISQDKERHYNDIAFSWNILDFGLSYVRAGQQADRYLIAKERERKVVHNIIQEVRGAYWRAISAERLLGRIGPLRERVQTALDDSLRIEQLRLKSPLEALTYQRELLDILRSLQQLQRDMVKARIELATLMGLRPGQEFLLAGGEMAVPAIEMDLATMEQTALLKRPELMESRYQARISREEVRAALLAMLPGISLTAGAHYDNSDFLLHNDWRTYGAQVSWNLFNIFKGPAANKVAKARQTLAEEQRLATSMAVLSQVHLANAGFAQSRQEYGTAAKYLDVARRIGEQIRISSEARRTGELQVIREELNGVLAELRHDVAYADLQNSYGRIFASMGLDPLPEQVADDSVKGLAAVVGERFKRWSAGETELTAAPAAE